MGGLVAPKMIYQCFVTKLGCNSHNKSLDRITNVEWRSALLSRYDTQRVPAYSTLSQEVGCNLATVCTQAVFFCNKIMIGNKAQAQV